MTRFGHAALAMRDGLGQHGVRSPELDKLMFEFSNSYKDVRAIPVEFEKLANASPVPMQFEVTEKDPEARQKLSETQKRVEELAGKLKQANETIEKLTPIKRSLTRDQHERLVAALKDGNSYKIAIRREPQTPETQDYSDQFASVFKEAGWMIVAPMILDRPTDMNEIIELMHLRAVKGIRLLVHDGKYPPQQAYKLSKAMMLAGIPVMVDEVESITEDTVEFFIGVPEEATRPSPTPNMEVSPH